MATTLPENSITVQPPKKTVPSDVFESLNVNTDSYVFFKDARNNTVIKAKAKCKEKFPERNFIVTAKDQLDRTRIFRIADTVFDEAI